MIQIRPVRGLDQVAFAYLMTKANALFGLTIIDKSVRNFKKSCSCT